MHRSLSGKNNSSEQSLSRHKAFLILLLPALLLAGGLAAAVMAAPKAQDGVVDGRLWRELRELPDHMITFEVILETAPGGEPGVVVDAQIGLEDVLLAMQQVGVVEKYSALYGANVIVVTGSPNAVLYLAAFPGVASIRPIRLGIAWDRQVAIAATGQITGHVSDGGGVSPLSNIGITAYRQLDPISWVVAGTTTTNGSGNYTLGGLESGLYRVRFQDPGGIYVTEYFNNRFSFNLATNFNVVDGQTTPDINATMEIAGNLTGKVTRQEGGNARDITVTALRSVETGWQIFASDLTDNQGNYHIGGLISGTYRIQFSDIFQRYVTEYYDNKGDLASADNVIINSGATTAGIDAVMGPYGSLSGSVIGTPGLYGVELLEIYVYEFNTAGGYWDVVSFAETDVNGNYQAFGLFTKNYRVEFNDSQGFFIGEFYNDQPDVDSAMDVPVSLGLETTGINAVLSSPVVTETYPLAGDWNLVSIPLYVPDNETGAAFGSLAGNYQVVWAYDGCDPPESQWKAFDPQAPPFVNDLKNVDVKHGMWVQTMGSDSLVLTGPEAFKTVFTLCAGWNLIGYPSLTAAPPAEVLAGISGKYDIVWGYEAADSLDPWKKYNPALPVGNDLTLMKPGYGYWVLMDSAATLTIANR